MDKEKERLRYKHYYKTHREKCIAASKAWYNANKEKVKLKQKAYQEMKKEKIKALLKSWRKANPRYDKMYREANKEKIQARERVYKKAYRKTHKIERKLSKKKWEKANPEKLRLYWRKKRAQKRTNRIEYVNEKVVYLRDGWICQICHEKVDKRFKYPNPKSASLDHIMPLSKGGSHAYKNVQLTHLVCNLTKFTSILPQGEQLRIF